MTKKTFYALSWAAQKELISTGWKTSECIGKNGVYQSVTLYGISVAVVRNVSDNEIQKIIVTNERKIKKLKFLRIDDFYSNIIFN